MADNRTIKTTVEIAGEGSYKNKLKQIENAYRNLNSEQKVLDAQFDKNDKSLAALTARYGALQSKLEIQKAKLETIGEEYAKVATSEGDASEAAQKLNREMNYAYAQIVKTEKSLQELEDAMQQTADAVDEAGQQMEETADSQKELGSSAETTAKKLQKVKDAANDQKNALKELGKQAEQAADKMSKALSAVTASAVTFSAKGFMDFEAEMSNVATLADTTSLSLDDLSKQALAASNATGVAATEIAQGAYTALSSGVDTANAMGYITEAAKAAKAGQSDLNSVVEGSTSIMNAWKIQYSDATSVFEKMLVAQDKGKTTLGEISSQIGQITGIAPQLNMSLEETLAATAALTKNGVQTSSAITGLRAVLSNVLKPTSEAAEAAAALGLEFNAAALRSKGLTGFLEDVLEKTGGSSEELAKLFGSVEGLSQIMLLGGSAAGDYADALAAMENSAGQLDRAFSTVTDNSAARLNNAMNKLKNNAIEFGQTMSPYIDMASDSLENLSEKISAMSAEEQKSLLQTALWTAGGLKAISMLSKMTATIKLLGTAAGPVGLTATAIAGLVAVIAAANRAAESNTLDAAWDRLSEKANANISGSMNAIITASVDTTSAEEQLLKAIQDVYGNVAQALTDGKADTPEIVEGLKTDIASLFSTAKENLSGLGPEAATYAAELARLEKETTAWVDGMAGKSTEYVKGHLSELEEIQAAVQATIDKINEGNNSLRNEGSEAYKLATGGATVNQETIAQGVGWAYRNRELDTQAIKEEAAARLAEAHEAYAQGIAEASDTLAAEEEIAAWSDAELEKVEKTYAARMSQLLQGIREAFASAEPETAEAVADIVEKQGFVDALQEQIDGMGAGDISTEEAEKNIQAIYDQIFGTGTMDVTDRAGAMAYELIDALSTEIQNSIDNLSTEDKGLLDTIMELLLSDAGTPLNIDTTDMSNVIRAAMGDVGVAGIEGFETGLSDPEGKISGAATAMGDAAVKAAKDVLAVHSPSRVFFDIGVNTIQGFINGADSRQAALTAKMRSIARAAANAVKRELDINSPSGVMEKFGEYTADGFINGINNRLDAVERTMRGMVNTGNIRTTTTQTPATAAQSPRQTTVNVHYSGAFTRREAQRFGREFALQIAADNAGKGG